MQLTKGQRAVGIVSALYVISFTAQYLSIRNFEFLRYVLVLVFFFALIFATLKRSGFDDFLLWALSIWGFLHMAGGGVKLPTGDVLYCCRSFTSREAATHSSSSSIKWCTCTDSLWRHLWCTIS